MFVYSWIPTLIYIRHCFNLNFSCLTNLPAKQLFENCFRYKLISNHFNSISFYGRSFFFYFVYFLFFFSFHSFMKSLSFTFLLLLLRSSFHSCGSPYLSFLLAFYSFFRLSFPSLVFRKFSSTLAYFFPYSSFFYLPRVIELVPFIYTFFFLFQSFFLTKFQVLFHDFKTFFFIMPCRCSID